METFSLFDGNDFVLEADPQVVQAAAEAGLFDEFVAEETSTLTPAIALVEPAVEPEIVPVVQRPRYSELELIQNMTTLPNTVVIQKVGTKGIYVKAVDLDSAISLVQFKQGGAAVVRPDLPTREMDAKPWEAVPELTNNSLEYKLVASQEESTSKINFNDPKIYFDIKDCIAPTFRESRAYQFLKKMGLNIVTAPSFENWVPREYRRQVRDNTPFLLPDILDVRPLYERLEEGTVVKCNVTTGRFQAGKEYFVGMKSPSNEEKGECGFAMLHQYERGRAYSYATRWNDTDPMEEFFEPAQAQEIIYEPEKCIPTVYKKAFDINRERIAKEKWQLFEHTIHDVSQAAIKPFYFNGKPMRMGKSRESIIWHKLRGNKRVGCFCPKNVASFFARELDALKITDYTVIDSHGALNAQTKQAWMEIIPYGWMKYKNDPLSAKDSQEFALAKPCPHCGQLLERKAFQAPASTPLNPTPEGAWLWTSQYGYLCRNSDCQYVQSLVDRDKRSIREKKRLRKALDLPVDKRAGAAWHSEAGETQVSHSFTAKSGRKGSGYVDLGRKAHVRHMLTATGNDSKDYKWHGRECTTCHHVEQVWTPAPYRRLKKRYDGLTLDEIHQCKSGSSDITKAVLSLHARSVNGLTGTLMPNDPSDAYWPLFRMFGNNTHRFPYAKTQAKPYGGVTDYNADYTDSLTIENNDKETKYKKKIPYLKNPVKFWKMMAPKMIRRTYDDPLVIESLEKAGLKVPKSDRKVIVVPPDPKQAALMLATMQEFDKQFQDYKTALAARGTEDRTYLLNSAYVISRMTRMRMGATCPDYINEKLADLKLPPMYLGAKGGAKMEQVYNICLNKVAKGEKVLILSDFRCMQRTMAEELAIFKPILFDTSWNRGKRQEAFDLFNEDPDNKVFIAGPKAIGLGTDLAGGPDSLCRTVISTDLLWRPGEQQQAWARIMKPAKEEYTVEIYVLVLDATIDQHVYNVFYSKLFAAEQALDRKVISTKEKAFDVGAFVDQVLSDRDRMLEYLQRSGENELSYMPYVEMFSMEDRAI